MKRGDRSKARLGSAHKSEVPQNDFDASPQAKGRRKEERYREVHVESPILFERGEALIKQHEKEREEEAREKQKQLRWTKVAAGLVLLYTVAAFLQVQTSENQLRMDQRPWIKVEYADPSPMSPASPISLPITIRNVGKSPAQQVFCAAIIKIVPIGGEPDIAQNLVPPDPIYKHKWVWWWKRRTGIVATYLRTGDSWPGDPYTFTAVRSNGSGPELLTLNEAKDMFDRRAYALVFGQVWYLDIFGTTHWTKFCKDLPLQGASSYSQSKTCANYNAADSNF